MVMTSPSPPDDREVISPELVLVSDPETARRARAQLPEPWVVAIRNAAEDAPTAPEPDKPPAPVRRRVRPARLLAIAVIGAGLAVAGYMTAMRLGDSGDVASLPTPSSAAVSTEAVGQTISTAPAATTAPPPSQPLPA